MAINYQVFLRDQSGAQVTLFDGTAFQNLRFGKTVNSPGWFAMQIDGDDPGVSLFELDGQVEIYRSDPARGLAWYKEFEGFCRTFVRQTFENGNKIFTVYGVGYLDLIARRIVAYYANQSESDKTGPAETVIKEFVNENAGTLATLLNGRLVDGVTTGLTVAADTAGGSSWSGKRAWRNLLEVIQGVGTEANYTFDVVGTGAVTFEFRTYGSQRGEDRSVVGLVPATGLNGAGNAPVILRLETGGLQEAAYSDNRGSEVTTAVVLGQGEETDRNVVVRTNATAIADSPWNSIELSRNASGQDTVANLNTIGDEILEENARRESLTVGPLDTAGVVYGRDYNWGDFITVRYDTIQRNKEITNVEFNVGSDGETKTFTLKDLP